MQTRWIFVVLCLFSEPSLAEEHGVTATDGEVKAWVRSDRNGDTRLSSTEFRTFIDEMAKQDQSTAKLVRLFGAYGFAFSVADINGDSFVSPEELREADDSYREDEHADK